MYNPDDPREIMANELLKRGSATMRELLTLSYGEWPPKGLDINLDFPHDQKVTLVADPDCPDLGNTNSHDRNIVINDRLCRTVPEGITSTLGHETLHVLQGDNFWADRVKEIYGIGEVPKLLPGRYLHDRASNIAMKEVAHLDNWIKKLTPSFNAAADPEQMTYLKRGTEMQARLHQTMMAGYQCWGKLPGNMDELWAGLREYGMTPPPEVEKHLQSLPADSPARDFMKSKRHPFETWQLEQVNQDLTETARNILWRKTLPMLYSDMIEMFGDRQGRERFGLGVNVRGQVQREVFSQKAAGGLKI